MMFFLSTHLSFQDMADTTSLSQTRDKRARKVTPKVSAALSNSKRCKKITSTSPLQTQSILMPETVLHQGPKEISTAADADETEDQRCHEDISSRNAVNLPTDPPSWWVRGSPRLLATDTPEHLQSVIVQNFGAGVDMNR